MLVESWGIGTFGREEDEGRRLIWTLCFYRASPDDNPYAKPIHGLHAVVDLDDMAVVRVEDLGVVPLPPGTGDYTAGRTAPRRGLKPIEIRQPAGVSFEVDGWEVRWQNWRFRLGFNGREGLVLHTIGYADNGRLRPVIHRASVAELLIPYSDPRPFQGWRNAFDIGEYGIGILANSLELGCDCLGEIRYFDVELADGEGKPYTIKNAICLHEEDHGIGWKHFDADLQRAEVRRRRRLVASFIITAGNYEYAFYWCFYTDGAIELEVRLTGIVLTAALGPGETSDYGTVVAPQTLAAYHQHFFCVRLDMAVDGASNSVYEVETEPVPVGPGNPYGNAFRTRRTLLQTESQAQRLINPLDRAELAGGQPERRQRPGPAGRVPAGAARQRPPVCARGGVRHPAGRVHDQASVGDAVRGGRAVPRRGVPEPAPRRGRAPGVDQGGPADREHRHRAVVHPRQPSHPAARGLAGHAGRAGQPHPPAVRLLRRQPGPGHAAHARRADGDG